MAKVEQGEVQHKPGPRGHRIAGGVVVDASTKKLKFAANSLSHQRCPSDISSNRFTSVSSTGMLCSARKWPLLSAWGIGAELSNVTPSIRALAHPALGVALGRSVVGLCRGLRLQEEL